MKLINKSKKGFTLLEMMLSIAIILCLSGLLVILIISIKSSFMTVYNQNDSADYAVLQGRGFEQSFLGNVCFDRSIDTFTYTINNNKLTCNSRPVFEPAQSKTQNGTKDKWKIEMYYTYEEADKMVKYKIYVYDNYYNPGKLAYTYNGGFLLPHYDKTVLTSGNQKDGYFDIITIDLTGGS